jgi:branched-chain amino acid transport system ATP-binding protein
MTTTASRSRPSGKTPILRTENLTAGYGAVPVINEVDLEVNEGEVVALLGPNGAGKSTTLLTVCGHMQPMSGAVFFDGREARSPMHRRCRGGIGFVTEARTIFPSLTTAENLRLGRGGTAAAVGLMPELEPLLKRKAGLLSGGEQQILALARVIAARPRLLVADELSLGLAPLVVNRLLTAARAAADTGMAVLLVEQYARRALAIADQIYVMGRGRIAMSGTARDVKDQLGELEGIYLSDASV